MEAFSTRSGRIFYGKCSIILHRKLKRKFKVTRDWLKIHCPMLFCNCFFPVGHAWADVQEVSIFTLPVAWHFLVSVSRPHVGLVRFTTIYASTTITELHSSSCSVAVTSLLFPVSSRSIPQSLTKFLMPVFHCFEAVNLFFSSLQLAQIQFYWYEPDLAFLLAKQPRLVHALQVR